MGLYQSLGGNMRVKVTGADMAATVGGINKLGISVEGLMFEEELSISFSVARNSYAILRDFLTSRGDRLENVGTSGLFWPLLRMFRRPAVIAGIFLLFLFGVFLPGRILFISVEGSDLLSENRILEAAERCGITFGASRREVRSEEIKNALLSELPELQWVGVNTYGCRAVVTVRERSRFNTEIKGSSVGSIVAVRDGIVSSVTVTNGSGQCIPGQAVKRGQVLISGYIDSGSVVTATAAEGDVMGITNRELTVVMPRSYILRTAHSREFAQYSIRFGKKRINFYKGSGISHGSCVKMYSEYILTLPGGYELPVALIKECIVDTNGSEVAFTSDSTTQLSDFAERYLKEQMVAGIIHSATEQVEHSEGLISLSGHYACTELIGRYQNEMIGEYHGKNDGADRERGSGG